MNTIHRESVRIGWRIVLGISFCFAWLLSSQPAVAIESVVLNIDSQALDLDSGTIVERSPAGDGGAGSDIKLAYNADRSVHAVVFPASAGVELAVVPGVAFDGVSSDDVAGLVFSSEPVDVPFSADNCVVIRTDLGAVYKLGNAVESGASVTFNYSAL
jgi:hypothetical protein